jgi:hypothetical protein
MFDGTKFEVSQLYLSFFRLLPSALCPLPSAFPQPRSPKVAKNHNVVSFANNVVLRPPLFAVNVVSKLPCLQFEAFMFAVRYK